MGAGILMNLSTAGCQVRSTLSLDPGTYVAVHINVPHQSRPVAVELSVVRWQQNGRYGLEFLRYGQGERERLAHLTSATLAETRPLDPRQDGLGLAEDRELGMALAGVAE